MAPFRHAFRVRFGDVDHARIVYYPRFFHYFHVAFEELFEKVGGYRHVLESRRVGFPAVRVECEFERPLRFGDDAEVELTTARLGGQSITVRYRVFAGGEKCAEGAVTCAVIDMDSFRAIPLPDDLRALFSGLDEG